MSDKPMTAGEKAKSLVDVYMRMPNPTNLDLSNHMQMAIVDALKDFSSQQSAGLVAALSFYANEDNWGNGGWEGHPNDFIRNCNRGWEKAQEALSTHPKNPTKEEV